MEFSNSLTTIILCWIIILLLLFIIIYRYLFWKLVDIHNIGYKYDKRTGKITILERTGWHRIIPFLTVIHKIDTRPLQIGIEIDADEFNVRVLHTMLVRFNKEGLEQLIEFHGRKDYNQKILAPILKLYAYEGCATCHYDKQALQLKYKFLNIIE